MRSIDLLPLLDHLAFARPAGGEWRGWRIRPIGGGANNLIYRATDGEHDLAIKWTIRDERDRAGHEHAALLALRTVGYDIAPEALLLERERYPQPVVVQTWLAGEVSAAPPAGDEEWGRFLEHLVAIHALTPHDMAQPIRPAVLNMSGAADGLRRIGEQLARIPAEARPPELCDLLREIERAKLPDWAPPQMALCRVDPNTTNFIRRPGAWASVDWENSGWGDPAFEIADAIVHPNYVSVPEQRWAWLIDAYGARHGDPGAAERIHVYRLLMLCWWAARLGRALYEVPRGADQRLAERPNGWLEDIRAKYQRYLALARKGQP